MLSSCFLFGLFAFVSLLAASSLRSQEAVEVKSSTPSEETTSEAKKSSKPEASPQKPAKSLEENMRPEEFKAAGLDKLSEDELQHLDAYLQGYRETAKKKAAEQAKVKADEEIKRANEKADKATEEANRNAPSARTKLDTLVSRVDGNIEGIKGATQIRLEDGSVWKQANKDDRYRAPVTDHPAAVILHTPFGYKMRIEGM